MRISLGEIHPQTLYELRESGADVQTLSDNGRAFQINIIMPEGTVIDGNKYALPNGIVAYTSGSESESFYPGQGVSMAPYPH